MKVDIKNLPISELIALYQFVSSKPFSTNETAKKVIKERLVEIEDELLDRAFGLNPYKSDKSVAKQVEKGIVVVKYEGKDPVKVLMDSPVNIVDAKEKAAAKDLTDGENKP